MFFKKDRLVDEIPTTDSINEILESIDKEIKEAMLEGDISEINRFQQKLL